MSFHRTTLDAFCTNVKEMRRDAARERAAKKAAELEAKLEALERQTISVWRVENGHPVEVIHRR